jgi:DNA-binding transcriptional MerR regulator
MGAKANRAMTTDEAPALLKVGELARKTGKTVRALRLYEEMGLLRPATRTQGRFRLYGPGEVARVYWIGKLQQMGFSLGEIRGVLAVVEASRTAPDAMQSVRELFRTRLEETRSQVATLLELERDLAESLAYLEGCRACDEKAGPQICSSCDSEHGDRHHMPAPALVAGIRKGPAPTSGGDEGVESP